MGGRNSSDLEEDVAFYNTRAISTTPTVIKNLVRSKNDTNGGVVIEMNVVSEVFPKRGMKVIKADSIVESLGFESSEASRSS